MKQLLAVVSPNGSEDKSLALLIEQLTTRLHAGEPVDLEALVREYPEHGERLTRLLPTLQVLADLGLSAGARSGPAASLAVPEEGFGTLGDFHILREIGRGGMGIVYEAEQLSLGRRVALKVLPFASTMDARQLQRFQNEARAAAGLHHTNIVPVYFVGSERGVHYYAMQFIEGQDLASAVTQLRAQAGHKALAPRPAETVDAPAGQPAASPAADTRPIAGLSTERSTRPAEYFRTVARLGIQAAEALDHAHQQGILHRDVKPANLMVDAAGQLWITDFGLARIQSDTRLTMTGDLVGTLRYMSPEQALAKRVVVDHRTDIYSLGATLYELVTLEPAFNGGDRQELLRQIGFEEPRALRRVDKAIPAELEVIVLKALEKNPAERYATAQDLADDLRRFLNHETIWARRASLLHRARKWTRRHRAAVIAAGVCLVVMLASLAGSIGWVLGDRAARQREAEAKVHEALVAANPGLRQGNPWDPALISAAQRAQAQMGGALLASETRHRVEQLQKDLGMLAELERIRLDQAAGVQDDHFDRTVAGTQYAQAFREYGIDIETMDPAEAAASVQASAIGPHLVAALDDWATILRPADGRNPGTSVTRTQLLAVARQADSDPWHNRLRDLLVSAKTADVEQLARTAPVDELPEGTLVLLGVLLSDAGVSARQVNLLRRAQRRFPADFWINTLLAQTLAQSTPPQHEEAIGFYRVAVALRPQSPGAHLNLGVQLGHKGDWDAAIAENQEALRLKADYAAAHIGLSKSHNNCALALSKKGQLDKAIEECHKAIQHDPQSANPHNTLGTLYANKNQTDAAIAEFQAALRLDPSYWAAHFNLGMRRGVQGNMPEAEACFAKAVELQHDSAMAHFHLGNVLRLQKKWAKAQAALQKAIELKPDYADAFMELGATLAVEGKWEKAEAAWLKASELKPDAVQAFQELAVALARQEKWAKAEAALRKAIELKPDAVTLHRLGHALSEQGKADDAASAWQKAIDLKPDYAVAHYDLGLNLRDHQGRFAGAVATLKRAQELGSKQPGWPASRAAEVRQAELLVKLDRKLPAILSGQQEPADVAERIALAELCQMPCKKRYGAAVRFYSEAFAEEPKLAEDMQRQRRYNAACAAAQAGCGQGKDADQIAKQERARLRHQALDWLSADLTAWQQLLAKDPARFRSIVARNMGSWQQDEDFSELRGDGLAKLSKDEHQEWSALWKEVEALRKLAATVP